MRAVTMKDIAKIMNISVVSVSKALAGKSGVSEELRDKIIRKAQEVGYVYASIPTGKVERDDTIGIIVAEHFFTDNSFYSNMYRELLMLCSEMWVSCMLEIITPQNEHNLVLPNVVASGKCNGIIFLGEISTDYIKIVEKTNTPHIMLDFYRDESSDDCVIGDSVSGSFQLTNHLVKLGYSKIGFVGSILATSSILDRYLGYHKCLVVNGLETRQDWILPDRDADGLYIDIKLPPEMPQAFVCNCDESACFFMAKLKKQGYKIPSDVAVTGFDDFRFATIAEPHLTTYRINVSAMAKSAVTRLLRKISGSLYTRGCTVIRGEIVYRQSTPKQQIFSQT